MTILKAMAIEKYDGNIMKRNYVVFMAILLFVLPGCRNRNTINGGRDGNQASDTGHAAIQFTEYEHHFGKVAEGEKVACIFTFKNTGTSDLVVKSARTSCGCTVSKYDKKPVPPDNSGTLEVVFDASGYNGLQTKTITVNSNARIPVVLLKITAQVINSDNN